jgi:cyclophilin family peptidyl-prolyl cis-trans isomerase
VHFLAGLPPLTEIARLQSARILTDAGEIRVALRPDIAPLTVWNFARLAEQDFFDGEPFHRVVPDFVIQDGCPRGDGWGDPGYAIPDELSWLPYDEGALGMALSGPDTGGSQWFLTLSPQPHLEAKYTAFGSLSLESAGPRRVRAGTVIQDVIIERVD